MDDDIRVRFEAQDKKLDAIRQSVEKIRKRLFWKSVTDVVLFVLPLIGIIAIIPWIMEKISALSKIPHLP